MLNNKNFVYLIKVPHCLQESKSTWHDKQNLAYFLILFHLVQHQELECWKYLKIIANFNNKIKEIHYQI